MKPNLKEERKIWKLGYKKVAGLDEVGRGSLAGPVLACAVVLRSDLNSSNLLRTVFNIRDSKKLSSKQREEFYNILAKHLDIKWGIGKVSEKIIDRINILEATKLAMEKAIKNIKVRPNFLILDGNFKINSKLPQKSIIRADGKVFSCMAAGIMAKVTRDKIMKNYHKKFPLYGFDRHKGYPTKHHFLTINKNGTCKIHRKSFSLARKDKPSSFAS